MNPYLPQRGMGHAAPMEFASRDLGEEVFPYRDIARDIPRDID